MANFVDLPDREGQLAVDRDPNRNQEQTTDVGHRQRLPSIPPPVPNAPVYIAKYDYNSQTKEDLNFRKGDLMYIINSEEGDWWFARHKTNGQEGYIPSNYTDEWKSLEAEEELNRDQERTADVGHGWQPPNIPPSMANVPVYIAKYNYDSRMEDNLSFKKGHLMYIISTEEGDWWYGRHKTNGQEGYIPSNYIAEWKSPEDEEWFFARMKRIEAEKQLMQPLNDHGSFLVRDSESTPGGYSLSIRDMDRVRHYRIERLDIRGFFVTQRVTFDTIQELVEYYKLQSDGLCVNLCKPCLQQEKPQTACPSRAMNEDLHMWFFAGMKRIEAEKQLMQPLNDHGSFLVRDSESTPGDYSLLIRDMDRVRHYRIRRLDTGRFFVTQRVTFDTIQELVEYYKLQSDGLCVNLRKPCLLQEDFQTACPSRAMKGELMGD